MMNNSNLELGSLIHENEVDAKVYTDQQIFDLEMQNIFGGAWVYVAHESQLPEAGSYLTTEVGTKPIIVVRDNNNAIRAFYNRCPHRGAKIVNNDAGKTDRLLCNFHNYSFHLDGKVAAIPLEDCYEKSGYGACEKRSQLQPVCRIESYREFIFVCLDEPLMDLETWLSDTKASIDNLIDRSPQGKIEIVGRPFKWVNHCNWKMLVENLVDGAHVPGTHPSIGQTASKFANELKAAGKSKVELVELARSFWQSPEWLRDMGCTVLDNGHSYNGGKKSIHSQYDPFPDYTESLKQAYGEDGADEVLSLQRHNTCIYPNLHVKCLIQKIRVFKPVAPDKTIVECWVFRLVGTPDELLQRTLQYAQMLDSPATLVSVDDHEVMVRAQLGLQTAENTNVSMQRGVSRPVRKDQNGLHCDGDSERAFIEQYATWKKLMEKKPA